MEDAAPGVRIGLLGDVVLYGDTGELSAGTPKQACVLAVLAGQPGKAVTADVLMDRLWGDNPPGTARKTLAGYVARLRRLLEHCGLSITCRASSYILLAHDHDIDVSLMRNLVARARDLADKDVAAATALRREASVLWRGELRWRGYEDAGQR